MVLEKTKNRASEPVTISNQRIDELDVHIIRELFDDPIIPSAKIAQKYGKPLSTIQRRRTRLESSVISRSYSIDVRRLGFRIADLFIGVQRGMASKTADDLVRANTNNVIRAYLKVGEPALDVMAEIIFSDTQELYSMLESVRAMPDVVSVQWSETVNETEDNMPHMIERVLSNFVKK